MFQFKSFYNGGSTQKFCKNHFEDTLGYCCSTVSTTAQCGAGYATFCSTDSANYPQESKYGLCSLNSKSSVCGNDVNSTITFDGTTSKSITASSILSNELCYYPIQTSGNITNFLITISSTTNTNLKLANYYTNNTFANLITLSNGQVLNKTTDINGRFMLFAIPNSGNTGTLSFTLSSATVASSTTSTTTTQDTSSTTFWVKDNIIFLILCLVTLVLCITLAYFFQKAC